METLTAPEARLLRRTTDILGAAWPWGTPAIESIEPAGGTSRADALVRLPAPAGDIRVVLEVKRRLAPREVARLATALAAATDELGAAGAIVLSSWLSRQTRRELERATIGYADATGNLWFSLDDPPVHVRQDGADRNPEPVGQRRRGLAGARAAEVVRTLLEVTPPYTLDQLTESLPSQPDPSYVSRILAGLAEDNLIDREPRGPVTDVDLRGLLGAWRDAYDPTKLNAISRYVDLYGPRNTAEQLVSLEEGAGRWVATGSLVASALAPVAAPALAKFYCDQPDRVAQEAGLLPAESGTANIFLMAPYSPMVFTRTWVDRRSGLPCVSPVQAVVDLTVGREPQEAEALIDWMADNPSAWRVDDFSAPSPLVEQVA